MFRRSLTLTALATLLALPAQAQEEDDSAVIQDSRRFRRPKVQQMDFDVLDIDADLIKPELTLLSEPAREGGPPMIELRRDFDDAMEASVDEVR